MPANPNHLVRLAIYASDAVCFAVFVCNALAHHRPRHRHTNMASASQRLVRWYLRARKCGHQPMFYSPLHPVPEVDESSQSWDARLANSQTGPMDGTDSHCCSPIAPFPCGGGGGVCLLQSQMPAIGKAAGPVALGPKRSARTPHPCRRSCFNTVELPRISHSDSELLGREPEAVELLKIFHLPTKHPRSPPSPATGPTAPRAPSCTNCRLFSRRRPSSLIPLRRASCSSSSSAGTTTLVAKSIFCNSTSGSRHFQPPVLTHETFIPPLFHPPPVLPTWGSFPGWHR